MTILGIWRFRFYKIVIVCCNIPGYIEFCHPKYGATVIPVKYYYENSFDPGEREN